MDKEKLPEYLSAIESLRASYPEIEIYRGLEVDFIPGIMSSFEFRDEIARGELDYTIGSVHFVDQFEDGARWEIDNTHAIFLDGLEKIFKNNIKDAVSRYYELSLEMIYSSTPDILGHLDKIKMQSDGGKLFNQEEPWYRQQVTKLINLAEQAEMIVEVNTRGIYQKKTTTTYPEPWILELIQKKNMRITLSSDAHQPDDLINQFSETAQALLKMGFKTLTVLKEGKWVQVPFTDKGIA